MGLKVSFDGRGPHVEPPVRGMEAVDALVVDGAADALGYVYEAIEKIKKTLAGRVPLLGFSGAPLTLASYVIEGATSRNHHEIKRLLYQEPEVLEALLERLTRVITRYLRLQIEAGCDAVQLLDTWGGILTLPQWRRFSQKYTARVMRDLADTGVPVLHYLKGGAHLMEGMCELPCDVLSMDWRESLGTLRERVPTRYALQGNLDPGVLTASPQVIEGAVIHMLESHGGQPGLIVNLGHGITPDVSVAAARAMVDAVKAHGPRLCGGVVPG